MNDVARMLTRAGLPADDREIARLAAAEEFTSAGVAALYAVPEARYAEPATGFRAGSRIVAWSE